MPYTFHEIKTLIFPSILALLDIGLDICYYLSHDFYSQTIQLVCLIFLFTVFIVSFVFFFLLHIRDETSYKLPWLKIIERSFKLAFLFEIKFAYCCENLWVVEEDPDFDFNDALKLEIVSYQEFSHSILQALPQLIIQLINNFHTQNWNGTALASMALSTYFTGKLIYRIFRGRNTTAFELRDSHYINKVEIGL